jgi:hypothetical protein
MRGSAMANEILICTKRKETVNIRTLQLKRASGTVQQLLWNGTGFMVIPGLLLWNGTGFVVIPGLLLWGI